MAKFLAAVVVVLLAVAIATEGSVTLYNPARIPLDLTVDDANNVQMETDIMSLDISQARQSINITTATGGLLSVDVNDGDVLVLLPDPLGNVGNSAAVQVVHVPTVDDATALPPVPDYALPPAEALVVGSSP